jgi:hypothetical protein
MADSVSPSDDLSGVVNHYSAATQQLRTSARWLLTAAAAVGGVLVAGLQLTDLSKLDGAQWPRLVIACGAIFAAIAAIGFIIWKTSIVLTDEWTTLAQLHVERFSQTIRQGPSNRREREKFAMMREIQDGLVVNQDELYAHVAADVSELSHLLGETATAARHDAAKSDEVASLRKAAEAVVQFANYQRTRRHFQGVRRSLVWTAAVVVLGVGAYAYTASAGNATPLPDKSTAPQSTPAQSTRAPSATGAVSQPPARATMSPSRTR